MDLLLVVGEGAAIPHPKQRREEGSSICTGEWVSSWNIAILSKSSKESRHREGDCQRVSAWNVLDVRQQSSSKGSRST